MLLKANTMTYYFNLNAKGRQKKHIYNVNTPENFVLLLSYAVCPAFVSLQKEPNMNFTRLSAGHNHHP